MKYVVGFMFSPDLRSVALIRKLKPAWQLGKLNGIGGKVEAGEQDINAMVREFDEETGVATQPGDWAMFLNMFGGPSDPSGKDFDIAFYWTRGDLTRLRSVTEEGIEVIPVDFITHGNAEFLDNIPWVVALAMDCIADGRPKLVTAEYP